MVPSVPWSDQQHAVNYSVNSHLADSSLLPKAVLPMNQSGYTCSICYLCYDQNMSATPPFNLQHPRAVKFNSDALVSCLDVHTYIVYLVAPRCSNCGLCLIPMSSISRVASGPDTTERGRWME